MAPKVFVTQYVSNINFSLAEEWGDIVWCTGKEHKHEPAPLEVNADMISDIKRKMADYMIGEDYILLSPSPIPGLVVGSLLKPGVHNVLKWSNQDYTYRLHKLEIRE